MIIMLLLTDYDRGERVELVNGLLLCAVVVLSFQTMYDHVTQCSVVPVFSAFILKPQYSCMNSRFNG